MVRNGSPSPADGFVLGHAGAGLTAAPAAAAISPQPPPSKRDKRRNMLAEKLADMVASFSDNRDSHYRAQLAALQADINLIIKADAYANQPLDDGGSEAAELVTQIMGSKAPAAPSAGSDYVAQCGRHYARFVDAVNDAMEERDYNLTMLWNKQANARTEIENAHIYKVQIAEEEHKLLAASIRERLLASLQQRTSRLRREKEQLDLSDSNAMLLHPNQFSIGHPASPGGPHAARKTRRTGHKFGDADDLAAAHADNKRKRKLFDDQDNDSPTPTTRPADSARPAPSPFRDAKTRTVNAQFEAAAYSLDRLFTEKELNMVMNQATTAASNFFAKMKGAPQDATSNGTAAPNGTTTTALINGDSVPNASDNGDAMDQDQDSDEMPGATDMTRQVSSNPHATRGATRSALHPSAALANGQLPFIYNPPFVLDAKIFQKINASAPTPPALTAQDVEQDLKLMLRDARPDDELNEKLLQAACNPIKARDYQVQPPGFQEPVPEMTSMVRANMPHLEIGTAMGGIAMSAQSSMAGYSDTGAITPRYGERERERDGSAVATANGIGNGNGTGGSVTMARTASGNGIGRGRGRGRGGH